MTLLLGELLCDSTPSLSSPPPPPPPPFSSIQNDTPIEDFVKQVFDKLKVPASQQQQRSKFCKTLEKDMYFTVGVLRSANRDETQWITYAQRKQFSDGFTKIGARLLYPSSYYPVVVGIYIDNYSFDCFFSFVNLNVLVCNVFHLLNVQALSALSKDICKMDLSYAGCSMSKTVYYLSY